MADEFENEIWCTCRIAPPVVSRASIYDCIAEHSQD